MKYVPHALAASLMLGAAAYAQLNGTVMEVEQDFADCLTIGEYTYGGSKVFKSNQDPTETWKATSPAQQHGFEHSVLCDYAHFHLGERAHTTTFFFIRDID